MNDSHKYDIPNNIESNSELPTIGLIMGEEGTQCSFCEGSTKIPHCFPECDCIACLGCMKTSLLTAIECPNHNVLWPFLTKTLPEKIKAVESSKWKKGYVKCKYSECPKWMLRNDMREVSVHEKRCKFRTELCLDCSKHAKVEESHICEQAKYPKGNTFPLAKMDTPRTHVDPIDSSHERKDLIVPIYSHFKEKSENIPPPIVARKQSKCRDYMIISLGIVGVGLSILFLTLYLLNREVDSDKDSKSDEIEDELNRIRGEINIVKYEWRKKDAYTEGNMEEQLRKNVNMRNELEVCVSQLKMGSMYKLPTNPSPVLTYPTYPKHMIYMVGMKEEGLEIWGYVGYVENPKPQKLNSYFLETVHRDRGGTLSLDSNLYIAAATRNPVLYNINELLGNPQYIPLHLNSSSVKSPNATKCLFTQGGGHPIPICFGEGYATKYIPPLYTASSLTPPLTQLTFHQRKSIETTGDGRILVHTEDNKRVIIYDGVGLKLGEIFPEEDINSNHLDIDIFSIKEIMENMFIIIDKKFGNYVILAKTSDLNNIKYYNITISDPSIYPKEFFSYLEITPFNTVNGTFILSGEWGELLSDSLEIKFYNGTFIQICKIQDEQTDYPQILVDHIHEEHYYHDADDVDDYANLYITTPKEGTMVWFGRREDERLCLWEYSPGNTTHCFTFQDDIYFTDLFGIFYL